MSSKGPRKRAEREETDQSLDTERRKTDEELSKRSTDTELESDAVVDRARTRADGVLADARRQADSKLERAGTSPQQRRSVAEERKKENAALLQERLTADAQLEDEREARKRALQGLLRLEREETDERLLTERARADQAVTARDDFMSMVSHDLRTLLGGIALTASMQIRDAGEDEGGRRFVQSAQRIQRFTARMNRLIGDLVDVASIESGRLAVVPQNADAARLIRESLEAFQPTAAAKGVSLNAELDHDSVLARFDEERILQVIANLLSNAIKFTPRGGSIVFKVVPVGNEIQFSVCDTGPGIPPDKLEAVFERFWQVRQGDSRGLGLGLYISKCIVEAHGGRIWAESKPGEGCTVFFTLPRA